MTLLQNQNNQKKIDSKSFFFEILHQSKISNARVGRIHTPHGIIETPSFVAVGTNGSLKAVANHDVNELGLDLMFCNTYHLMLQPGAKTIEKAGGIHKFINRNKPIITDSGGFQVFSLAYGGVASEIKSQGQKKHDGSVLKINEEGVVFRSYRDGEKILLTPETSVLAQKSIGADIIIPLDELPPYHTDKQKLKKSLDRTHRWEIRSLNTHLENRNNQAMYAVIHGGVDPDFRKHSSVFLGEHEFDGWAIGGSLGKNLQDITNCVNMCVPNLPPEKPRHLLGIGDLPALEACVPLGIDTFDSAYPTRAGRHSVLFTFSGNVKITRSQYKYDQAPIDDSCDCPTCNNYSRSYLHHLFKAKEPIAQSLASIHNIRHMVRWMDKARAGILSGII
jgi:queuine tRNA-ribosyltransferase